MKKMESYEIIDRLKLFVWIIIAFFFLISFRLFQVMIIRNESYTYLLENYGINEIYGASALRGKILDRNGKIIVDNIGLKTIYYKKNNLTTKEEIELAYLLADNLDITINVTDEDLREYYLLTHEEECNLLIKDEEQRLLKERRLSLEEIKNLKLERISKEEINKYTNLDKEAITIYNLMNKGYSYEEKVIKNKDVTDEEYAFIAEHVSELKGVDIKLDWQRYYPYGDTFKTILGSVSSSTTGIPYELKDWYLEKGYRLNERVGTSYLEYQYDEYLRGTPSKYILEGGIYQKVSEEVTGNDVILSIDIELQQEIENILEEEILATKKEPNTQFYNRSMVILSNPNTGEILAMAGKQIIQKGNNYEIYDYTPGIVTSPITAGSIVKGASLITGYRYNAIEMGTVFYDKCIKFKDTNEKCSWKSGLGNLDDIEALRWSSNSYQYQTALSLANIKYQYNGSAALTNDVFEKYRNTYYEFGLGVKTEIDLPVESSGYHGKKETTGLLLDYVIGQYEAYTPMQLMQYINTIVNNGNRLRPYLVSEIRNKEGEILLENNIDVLNTIEVDEKYFARVKQGFKSVMEGPLGYNYVSPKYNAAGKTGTAQSFVDTDNDGVIDTETLTNTFGMYAPYDDPKVSMVVVSPDYSHNLGRSSYESNVNRRIARRVMDAYAKRYLS